MSRLKYKAISNISSMRALALGAWGPPKDPSVNVQVDLDITKLPSDKDSFKPLFIKIMSKVIDDCPDLNRILIRQKFRQRLDNRIFVPTVLKHHSKYDLSGIVIDNAHTYSMESLKQLWTKKLVELRTGNNRPIMRTRFLYRLMPRFMVKVATKFISILHYTFNIPISWVGLPNDPFGVMTVTFLDRFDIKYAHVPIYAFSRSAITISVGTPYMVDDCKKLPITCTFDHRYFDGMEGLKGLKRLRYYCNNPNQL